MPEHLQAEDQTSLAALVGGLVDDTQRLLRQELALARREVRDEWNKTKTAAALLGTGLAVLSLAIGLLAVALAKLLAFLVAVPEWGGFGIVGLFLVVLGGLLGFAGRGKLRTIRLVPQQTVETLRQDLDAVTTAVTTVDTSPSQRIR
jgi:hypothetical protein